MILVPHSPVRESLASIARKARFHKISQFVTVRSLLYLWIINQSTKCNLLPLELYFLYSAVNKLDEISSCCCQD